jgi:hypothetical protein
MSSKQTKSTAQYAESVHCTRRDKVVTMMDKTTKVFKSVRLAKHFMRTGKEAK